MVRNRDVLKAWIRGRVLAAGTLRTDGNRLYSYRLKIGEVVNGVHVLYDYTSSGGYFHSITMSTHVNAAKDYAGRIVDFRPLESNSRW